jgi:hypothetical protein
MRGIVLNAEARQNLDPEVVYGSIRRRSTHTTWDTRPAARCMHNIGGIHTSSRPWQTLTREPIARFYPVLPFETAIKPEGTVRGPPKWLCDDGNTRPGLDHCLGGGSREL